MKVIVTGDRDYSDEVMVSVVLSGLRDLAMTLFEDLTIVEGGASGADELARMWGRGYDNVEHITVPAEWDKYGKRAGPIRNRKMFDEHNPDVVIAFHNHFKHSRGTRDMVMYAVEQDARVYHVTQYAKPNFDTTT